MSGCAVVATISKSNPSVGFFSFISSFPTTRSSSSKTKLLLPYHFCHPPQKTASSTISLLLKPPLISVLKRVSSQSQCGGGGSDDSDFIVVNFYRFVFIQDPEKEVALHLSFLQDLDIHGRVYLNEQGINAQYSGPSKDALAYVEWLREDQRFSDILVQLSPSPNGHAFPKLKIRYKPSLVQLEQDVSHLPLLDPSMRATPLAPSEWKNKLKSVNKMDDASNANLNTNTILLDVRNGYEWDIGHFHGAQRPDVDCFRSTSFGLSQENVIASDPLANVDKEKTEILMYCTGGIRCDVYSTILRWVVVLACRVEVGALEFMGLSNHYPFNDCIKISDTSASYLLNRQRGFQNLYTLKGGVSHYLENEGPAEWVGNLFVFDSRLSLPPSSYKPEAITDESKSSKVPEDYAFARCYVCDSQLCELRHRNCSNLDCNLLFLCCTSCVKVLKGCCCSGCMSASRLRPVLPGHQRYQKWHIYRDLDLQSKSEL